MRARKAIIIGLDGAIPEFVKKMRSKLPALDGLMRRGVFASARPSPPVDTPTNWTTIATGAWTGTHGINGFFTHIPGERFDRPHWSFNSSSLCQAEYLWESLERGGLRSILINYPVAWPPRTKEAVIIGGDGPFSPTWMLSNPTLHEVGCEDRTDNLLLNFSVMRRPLNLTPVPPPASPLSAVPGASGDGIWIDLPLGGLPPLIGRIEVKMGASLDWGDEGPIVRQETGSDGRSGVRTGPRGAAGDDEPGGTERGARAHAEHGTEAGAGPGVLERRAEGAPGGNAFSIIVYSSGGGGYDCVAIASEADPGKSVALLRQGEWSPWIYAEFPNGRTGSLKLKLLEMSPDASTLRLYQTESYDVEGWAYPERLASEIVRNVGPYHEGWEHPVGLRMGWFGPETVFEQVEMQMDWVARACKYLTGQTDWDLLMLQVHVQDYLNHEFLSCLEPGFPGYSREKAAEAWALFERLYRLTDDLVARVIEGCADDDTLVVVLSDHGGVATKAGFNTAYPFIKEGLVHYKRDPDSDDWVLDVSKSKVVSHNGFWINLKGRDPGGIVESGDYEEVRDSVLRILLSVRDPGTGTCPYATALRREDAEMFGLWGKRVPDVVQFLKPGYMETGFPARLRVPPGADVSSPEAAIERMGRGGFSGPYAKGAHLSLPTADLGNGSCRAVFIMAGPGVKEGVESPGSIDLADVAPTVANLIGALQPSGADGKILGQFLKSSAETGLGLERKEVV